MKTYNKPAASKLVARFDNELREIIMNDLKALKAAKNKFMKIVGPERLTAA